MSRFFSLRAGAEERPAVSAGQSKQLSTQQQQPSVACESYAPGHEMHYIQQGQALRSPSVRAERVIVDGNRIVLTLGSGATLEWCHHDPARLRSVLDLFPTSRVVYGRHHALRVGPYWFNCAPGEFSDCGSLLADDAQISDGHQPL